MSENKKKNTFSFKELGNHKGRLSRKSYSLHILCLFLLFILVSFIIPKLLIYTVSIGLIGIKSIMIATQILIISSKGINLIIIFILIYSTIKRLHDVGQSGWVSILLFIPFLNFLFIIILLLVGGNKEKNKYGEPLLNI